MTALSVLDLSPVTEGGSPARSMRNSLDLARRAEALGYRRYWLAEHHNMPGIASAATAVVIAHVAGGTSTIRVGAGGDHAAEPCAAGHRRAVRHPGCAVPGTHRPRPRPRARHRPAHRVRVAAHPPRRPRRLPARRGRAARLLPRAAAGRPRPGHTRQRAERSHLDPGVEPLRGAARRDARAAVRLRIPLRAGRPDARARRLPRIVQALGAALQALGHGRIQRVRGRHRRRRTPPAHLGAAVDAGAAPGEAPPPPTPGRRVRGAVEQPGAGDARRAGGLFGGGLPGHGARADGAVRGAHRGGRADDRLPDHSITTRAYARSRSRWRRGRAAPWEGTSRPDRSRTARGRSGDGLVMRPVGTRGG